MTNAVPAAGPIRELVSSDRLFDALGFRLMSLLRVALALSGLLINGLADSLLTVLLLLYVVHSAVAYGLVLYRESLLHAHFWHWLDVGWGTAVIAASGGGDSIYYLFFIYPIMVASMRCGAREGMAVSFGAVAAWLLVTVALGGAAPWQMERVLPRAGVLLILGCAIALWAGFEALERRRLVLLGDLNRLPNPRFGPDPVIAAALERLRLFYGADDCIAAISADPDGPRLHRAGAARANDPSGPSGLVEKLLSLPERCTVVASLRPRWLGILGPGLNIGRTRGSEAAAARAISLDLTVTFDRRSWISVPLELRGAAVGRLCLLRRGRRFGSFDAGLLREASDRFMPLVDTVRLLDSLATAAADTERSKICLDLHDSAIQPYLGLKLGLEALRRKVEPGNALAPDIDELWRMTQESIGELRGYVRALGGRSQQRAAALIEGMQRQIDRFRRFYGLEIKMNLLSDDMNLNDRLSAEVVQMIGEGLSNIGRHTDSRRVTINLSSTGDRFMTEIINHGAQADARWQEFTPVSLTRRAQQLGGNVEVAEQDSGGSAVLVTIPL